MQRCRKIYRLLQFSFDQELWITSTSERISTVSIQDGDGCFSSFPAKDANGDPTIEVFGHANEIVVTKPQLDHYNRRWWL